MRTIGLLGDMSWASSIPYCRILNQLIRDHRLAAAGAEDVIPGCTGIELLVGPAERPVEVFPGTRIRAQAAVAAATADQARRPAANRAGARQHGRSSQPDPWWRLLLQAHEPRGHSYARRARLKRRAASPNQHRRGG